MWFNKERLLTRWSVHVLSIKKILDKDHLQILSVCKRSICLNVLCTMCTFSVQTIELKAIIL